MTANYIKRKFYSDPKFQGVRKKYVGKLMGFGDDWIFYIQYRDRQTQKVVNKKLGKLSEGWTPRKAAIMRDKVYPGHSANFTVFIRSPAFTSNKNQADGLFYNTDR